LASAQGLTGLQDPRHGTPVEGLPIAFTISVTGSSTGGDGRWSIVGG
jgi:hypothetical protein